MEKQTESNVLIEPQGSFVFSVSSPRKFCCIAGVPNDLFLMVRPFIYCPSEKPARRSHCAPGHPMGVMEECGSVGTRGRVHQKMEDDGGLEAD